MTMQPIRYDQQIQAEVNQVPEEFLPALLSIVHTFRESVSLRPAAESLQQGWQEAMLGQTQPIQNLWDGIAP